MAEGKGNITVKKKDKHESIISDVLYIPSMASYLINLGQLLDKNYTMKLERKELKVFDEMSRPIIRAPLSTNMTFKVIINMLDHKCNASTIFEDKN